MKLLNFLAVFWSIFFSVNAASMFDEIKERENIRDSFTKEVGKSNLLFALNVNNIMTYGDDFIKKNIIRFIAGICDENKVDSISAAFSQPLGMNHISYTLPAEMNSVTQEYQHLMGEKLAKRLAIVYYLRRLLEIGPAQANVVKDGMEQIIMANDSQRHSFVDRYMKCDSGEAQTEAWLRIKAAYLARKCKKEPTLAFEVIGGFYEAKKAGREVKDVNEFIDHLSGMTDENRLKEFTKYKNLAKKPDAAPIDPAPKPADKSADKPADKPSDKPADKPADANVPLGRPKAMPEEEKKQIREMLVEKLRNIDSTVTDNGIYNLMSYGDQDIRESVLKYVAGITDLALMQKISDAYKPFAIKDRITFPDLKHITGSVDKWMFGGENKAMATRLVRAAHVICSLKSVDYSAAQEINDLMRLDDASKSSMGRYMNDLSEAERNKYWINIKAGLLVQQTNLSPDVAQQNGLTSDVAQHIIRRFYELNEPGLTVAPFTDEVIATVQGADKAKKMAFLQKYFAKPGDPKDKAMPQIGLTAADLPPPTKPNTKPSTPATTTSGPSSSSSSGSSGGSSGGSSSGASSSSPSTPAPTPPPAESEPSNSSSQVHVHLCISTVLLIAMLPLM